MDVMCDYGTSKKFNIKTIIRAVRSHSAPVVLHVLRAWSVRSPGG